MNLENVRIALRGVNANRLRSALTMLGILIGVGAVIILVAVGNGSSQAVQNQLQGLGTNTLTVFAGGFGRAGAGNGAARVQLTPGDVTALQDKANAPDVSQVAPIKTAASVTASYEGNTDTPSSFIGSTANIAGIRNYTTTSGGFFTTEDVEQNRRVVVLGTTVSDALFGTGVDPVGKEIKLNGSSWMVVGLLKSKGSSGIQDQDDVALAPITSVEDSLTGNNGSVNQIIAQAASRDQTTAAQNEISKILSSRHPVSSTAAAGTTSFQVLNQSSLISTSESTNSVFTVLLGAVAAISLLVGGIGVMNIMLVTVTERTREIGIRKAIGAQRLDIIGQFLVEAVLLSVLGGLLGVLVGIVGSRFTIVGVHPVVEPASVALAFGVSLVVGLFFGIYPANRAASLKPIDALRYE